MAKVFLAYIYVDDDKGFNALRTDLPLLLASAPSWVQSIRLTEALKADIPQPDRTVADR